jgi:hypothetical protein
MPEYITGYQNTVQALSPGASVVTVTGTISAYGSAGAYLVNVGQGLENLTFDAALFGPQSAHFTITNTGLIETAAGNPANLADAGIVLANSGHIFNAGTVLGGTGVAVLAQAGPAYIENSRCIAGSIGVAIVGFDGPVTLVNSGSLAGHKEGVFLTAGGVLSNAVGGLISGVASYGFDSLAQTTLTNAGTISGFYGGVNLQSGQGLVTNTGLIQAIGDGATQFYGGILTSDGGSVFNAGTITGENGIAVQYGNSVDPAGISGYAKNTGLIEASTTIAQGALGVGGQGGFGVGIALNMCGTVVNAGLINASNAGILSQNNGTGLVAVNNAATGRITGAKYGVYLKAGGTANNAGTIFVGEQGMSSAGAGTLINSGAVTATTLPFTVAGASGSYIATGLYVRGGGLIDNRYNGVVTVHYGDGLFMQAVNFGPGTQTLEDGNINNAGIVQAFEGVYETSLGTFTNSGEIAASQAGFLSPRARSTVFNAGTISAITTLFSQDSRADGFLAGGIGVYIDGGTVNNTGLINGNHAAIAIDALPGTVLNMAGASLSSNYGYGVVLSGGGVLVNQGGITGYRAGIRDQNDILTVNNSGYIGATAATFTTNGTGSSHGLPAGSYASQGVLLKDGGSVFNSSSGTIIGESGVNIQINPAAYVSNAGFIDGLGRTGVYLKSGGFTTNHGTIRALKDAIEVYGAGTVTNTGLVSSTKGHGIYVKGLATMFNAGSVIGGNQGVLLAGGGTIVNAGTIIGGTGDAVSFASGTENLLAIDPGAGFRGTVDGGNLSSASGFSVLDLAPGAATLLGVGTEFINFNEIDFAAGADWTVRGDTAGLASGALIDNFGFGDVLDLTDVADMPQRLTISPDGLLTIPGAVATVTMSFSNAAGDIVTVTGDGSGGTDIRLANALCFCAGTRIRTALGEVPVEDLAVGDMLQTVSGAMRPLSWIGRRHYDGRFIGNNHLMLPVRIGAGALAPGVPARDLFLSPGHAVFCGGILVPAWRLINGVTVTQAGQVDEVQYFHLELETHDLILAENCPAESFLDDGSRAQFQNALGFAGSGPVAPGLPRVEHGPVLQARCERLGASRRQHPSRRLRGFVDATGPGKISGWAQDAANPETPVWLDIMLKGRRIRRVLANQYRADLRAAGLGSGCQSFELAMPAGPVVVQDAATGEVLAMTEAARRAA